MLAPGVFNQNYPAQIALAGAAAVLQRLTFALRARGAARPAGSGPRAQIRRDKQAYRNEWYAHDSKGRVNPARFFDEVRVTG